VSCTNCIAHEAVLELSFYSHINKFYDVTQMLSGCSQPRWITGLWAQLIRWMFKRHLNSYCP